MVGHDPLLLLGDDARTALGTKGDLLERLFEVDLTDRLLVAARGEDRRLVDDVGEVRAGEAGRDLRDAEQLHVLVERLAANMHVEDRATALDVGAVEHDVPVSKPSISTRIWFRVCSRSSCDPPRPAPRWRPTASISSMNTMHGALRFAWSNRSRTRDAPTPTNISTNSDPEMEKNGTPASPATARASIVFPVPGGPTSSTPRGIFAPSA